MNRIVISISDFQKRAAIIEEDRVVEIFTERNDESNIIRNIYKGRVANVLPGMESAFVDIGLNKNSFLFVEELRELEEKKLNRGKNSSKSIEDLLTVGDKVVVQVLNVPRRNKGARVTTNFTIPGKYLVLIPESEDVAISKKIIDEEERTRLEKMFKEIKPAGMGVIIRTAAEGKEKSYFQKEINYLVKKWEEIEKKISRGKDGELVYNDNDIIIKILRDVLSDKIDEVVVDDEKSYKEILEYINTFSEEKTKLKIKLYHGEKDIFKEYKIEEEIERALEKEVWLDCGGYVVIEKTEALVSIDVNTGKNTGSYNLERTVLNTNLEAAREIPRQLRLRNLSGIIIIDFIDMKVQEDKEEVLRELEKELGKDRIKNTIVHFTDLGLVEMTRKRVGRNISYFYEKECPVCKGKGKVLSTDTVMENLLREVQELGKEGDVSVIYIKSSKEVIEKLEDLYMNLLGDYLEKRGKKIKLEQCENILEYEILLEK